MLVPFDPSIDSMQLVAEAIYDTETTLSSWLFGKDKKQACIQIVKLLDAGKTSFGKENIYLYKSKNEIVGVVRGYANQEKLKRPGRKMYLKVFGIWKYLEIKYKISPLLNKILITSMLPDDFYIADFIILEKFRKQGYGKKMLQMAMDIARQQKCKRIVLEANVAKQEVISFYEKAGFALFNEVKSDDKNLPITMKHFYYSL